MDLFIGKTNALQHCSALAALVNAQVNAWTKFHCCRRGTVSVDAEVLYISWIEVER